MINNNITKTLTVPLPLLSSHSIDAGDDFDVQTCLQPDKTEGWLDPVVPYVTLQFVTHGALSIRYVTKRGYRRSKVNTGGFFLRPAGATTLPIDMYRESVEPVRIMQIRLNSTLFSQIIDGNPQIAPSQIRWRVGYEDPLLLEMAIALQHQIEHPTDLSKLYTETATRMMALHLLRHHSKEKQNTTVAEKPLPPKTMRVVLDYIHANLAEDLTLETISEVAGFSSYHLARNFKKWSGESVHQYIVRQRLETAQHLLRSTTHSIAQIALTCGFSHQSHFSNTFRKYFQMTPRMYRQAYMV